MVFWDAYILEEEFRGRPAAHGWHGTRGPASRTIDEEAGYTAALWWFAAVSDGEDHGEIGLVATGDKYLLPIEHPVIRHP